LLHDCRATLSQYWHTLQTHLFPALEEELGPLPAMHQRLVRTLDMVRIEDFTPDSWGCPWRPARDRCAIGRAFIVKAVLNLPTTRALLNRLEADPALRRLCGWESGGEIPSESKFSRVFAEFAETALPVGIHQAMVETFQHERLVGHVSRDSTAIHGREKPVKPPPESAPEPKRKRGRPKKGEEPPPKPPTRLERQQDMSVEEMLADLPTACDTGAKRNSKNNVEYWTGYKLHLDSADGQIPISFVLTSASTHDSQAALPLAEMTAQRVSNLYDVMDAAYDCAIIRRHSQSLGHTPLIDRNFKADHKAKTEHAAETQRLKRLHWVMPETRRFTERSSVERVFARLKDEFGGRFVRVQGHAKVLAHLVFGLLALTADQLIRLVL